MRIKSYARQAHFVGCGKEEFAGRGALHSGKNRGRSFSSGLGAQNSKLKAIIRVAVLNGRAKVMLPVLCGFQKAGFGDFQNEC
jgi:hypothetical protein